jgi:hypothetical protein
MNVLDVVRKELKQPTLKKDGKLSLTRRADSGFGLMLPAKELDLRCSIA